MTNHRHSSSNSNSNLIEIKQEEELENDQFLTKSPFSHQFQVPLNVKLLQTYYLFTSVGGSLSHTFPVYHPSTLSHFKLSIHCFDCYLLVKIYFLTVKEEKHYEHRKEDYKIRYKISILEEEEANANSKNDGWMMVVVDFIQRPFVSHDLKMNTLKSASILIKQLECIQGKYPIEIYHKFETKEIFVID